MSIEMFDVSNYLKYTDNKILLLKIVVHQHVYKFNNNFLVKK